ncbi:hypothetical protein AAC387_Pa07g1763 [Persea americana]
MVDPSEKSPKLPPFFLSPYLSLSCSPPTSLLSPSPSPSPSPSSLPINLPLLVAANSTPSPSPCLSLCWRPPPSSPSPPFSLPLLFPDCSPSPSLSPFGNSGPNKCVYCSDLGSQTISSRNNIITYYALSFRTGRGREGGIGATIREKERERDRGINMERELTGRGKETGRRRGRERRRERERQKGREGGGRWTVDSKHEKETKRQGERRKGGYFGDFPKVSIMGPMDGCAGSNFGCAYSNSHSSILFFS